MARRPKYQKLTGLKYRILSAAFLIPIALWMIYSGPPESLILGSICSIFLFIEWSFLCLKNRLPFWKKTFCVLFGTSYLMLATFWFFSQLVIPEGWKVIFWILFLVWSTDIAAFAGGRLLGGPKLAPSISPNKTWSGFFAGMIGGTIVGYKTAFWLFPDVQNLWIILPLVFIAQAGDLLESLTKRWAHVKDSGVSISSLLIPGHGGVLDRFDSFLALCFSFALWEIIRLL